MNLATSTGVLYTAEIGTPPPGSDRRSGHLVETWPDGWTLQPGAWWTLTVTMIEPAVGIDERIEIDDVDRYGTIQAQWRPPRLSSGLEIVDQDWRPEPEPSLKIPSGRPMMLGWQDDRALARLVFGRTILSPYLDRFWRWLPVDDVDSPAIQVLFAGSS